MSRIASLRVLVTVVGLAGCGGLAAQDERDSGDDAEPINRNAIDCIQVTRIDSTEVIDDRTILFYGRGSRVYRNYLPRDCPGLERENRFLYEVRSNQLCSVDTVSVLEDWGVGLARGFTCQLGSFYPMTEDEVEELKQQTEAADESRREDRTRRSSDDD